MNTLDDWTNDLEKAANEIEAREAELAEKRAAIYDLARAEDSDVVDTGMLDGQLWFLDDLRESGSINMFGAPSVMMEVFGYSKKLAMEIWKYWTETFGERRDN